MSFSENITDIKLLQNLLCPPEDDDSDNDDRLPTAGYKRMSPEEQINNKNSTSNETSVKVCNLYDKVKTNDPQSLEEYEKIHNDDLNGCDWDNRKTPEYDITYKQSVATEDLFLQMTNKTTATSSCEDMIIQIYLKNETMRIDEMDLTVLRDTIKLSTKLYKLNLNLPQPIQPDMGKAEYDVDKCVMKLTLKLNREYDFVNF